MKNKDEILTSIRKIKESQKLTEKNIEAIEKESQNKTDCSCDNCK